MTRVDDGARPAPRRKGTGGQAGQPQPASRMAKDSVDVRDGSAMSWFWQKVQQLRLALAAIEARFGLLPTPGTDGKPPEFVETKVDGFRDVAAKPKHAAVVESHMILSGMRLQIANRIPDESKAIAKLSPQDRDAYNALRDVVEHDAEGLLALQSLLLSGRLSGQIATDGKSAWYQLGRLATQDLGPGIDRAKLAGQLLEELDNPAKVYQGDHNTCVPAVVAILLIRRQPAELARLIGGLASAGGTVRLADGSEIGRTPDWQSPDGGRSVGQALFQPAIMVLGIKAEGLTYDNRNDKISDGGTGLSIDEADVVLDAVTNQAWRAVDFYGCGDPKRIDEVVATIAAVAASGQPVPVGVNWSRNRGHKILVEKIQDDRVYYFNPYGTREAMSLFEFKKRITNANLPGA